MSAAVATAACGGGASPSSGAGPASDVSTRNRTVDRAVSVATGRTRVLYAVRGFHYGTVGRFVVSCSRVGVAKTAYVLAETGPSTVVAVDGRGASRASKLHPSNERLNGGSRRSGIEHWIVFTGGEPEGIRLDASLLVRSEPGLGCEFTVRGTIAIVRH